jgi:hypothetical protein
VLYKHLSSIRLSKTDPALGSLSKNGLSFITLYTGCLPSMRFSQKDPPSSSLSEKESPSSSLSEKRDLLRNHSRRGRAATPRTGYLRCNRLGVGVRSRHLRCNWVAPALGPSPTRLSCTCVANRGPGLGVLQPVDQSTILTNSVHLRRTMGQYGRDWSIRCVFDQFDDF